MNSLKRCALATIALCTTGLVHAEAPFIDYQWAQSPDACLERASKSLNKAGFKITAKGTLEIVGTKGDYKGVIACVGDAADLAMFIVAGASYNQAKQYAITLKTNFLN